VKRVLLVTLAVLAVGSSTAAPSFPRMRMTPLEIVSGDQGDSQIGSSKLAGVHTTSFRLLSSSPT
jgi:hypothetical protein